MTTFNLQKHLDKIASQLPAMVKKANEGASYEGVQGYFIAQTRSWQNCARKKMLKGSSAQEAWQGCLDEYQKANDNIDWVAKNCLEDTLELQKNAQLGGGMLQMGSYLEKIKKHRAEGKSIGQAVMAALKDCESEADQIVVSMAKGEVKTAAGLVMYPNINKLLALPGVLDIPSSRGGVITVVVDEKSEQGFLANIGGAGYEQIGTNPFRSPNGVIYQVREIPIAKRPPLNQTACAGCGCGHPGNKHEGECKCPPDCECKQKGGSCYKESSFRWEVKTSQERFKSDSDIASEFADLKIEKISFRPTSECGSDWRSGWIEIDFPHGAEHVGGGMNHLTDRWICYSADLQKGKIAFDNWYPDPVYNQLVSAIRNEASKLRVASTKTAQSFQDVGNKHRTRIALDTLRMSDAGAKKKPLSKVEHPFAECKKRNKGKGVDDLDAYCAAVKDKIEGDTDWRGK